MVVMHMVLVRSLGCERHDNDSPGVTQRLRDSATNRYGVTEQTSYRGWESVR